jgi:hypothetical protein
MGRKIKHGMYGTPTYYSWTNMLQRCNNPNNTNYDKYGGKGIVVCKRWYDFENFMEDMGLRPEGMTLNRINSAKIYSKKTCEWATTSVQSYDRNLRKENTIGVRGVRWRKDRNMYEARISKNGVQILLYYGESLEDAIRARLEADSIYYPKTNFTKGVI